MRAEALSGAEAVAHAMRQINPDVIPAYPITPQTEIMHTYAKFLSDGKVSGELIRVESEHSSMSAAVGASAAGARVMTATSSAGLALMWEIVYIAASLRLPILMSIVNRALSGPINIHCDHSDSMGCRDSGWLQIYAENNQEVYENTIFGMRLAEKVKLPLMSCQDGFITSHNVEAVTLFEDQKVKEFIGDFSSEFPLLNIDKPVTYGPLDLTDFYFEHKRKQSEDTYRTLFAFKEISEEFEKKFGKKIDYFEKYCIDDADIVLVALSSTCGTIKEVVDKLRNKGIKVGLLKLKLFRPFPSYEIMQVLKNKKIIGILDRSESFGAFGGPLFGEIRSAMFSMTYESNDVIEKSTEKTQNKKSITQIPTIVNYIYGLGGREINMDMVEGIYSELEGYKKNKITEFVKYLGVRE